MAKTDNIKDSYIFRREWADLIANMSAEQAGALIKSICAYAFGDGDQDATGDPVVDTAMFFVRPTLDRDAAKYEARKAAGAQGGAPAGNNNAAKSKDADTTGQAKTSKNKQNQAKQPVYVCVSGCVSDSACDRDHACDNDSANAESATAVAVAVNDTATAANPRQLWEEASGRRCTKAEAKELSRIETEYGQNRLLHGIQEAVRAGVLKLSYVEAAARGYCNIHNGIPPDKHNQACRQLSARIEQLEAAIAAASDPDEADRLRAELDGVALQYLQLHGQAGL